MFSDCTGHDKPSLHFLSLVLSNVDMELAVECLLSLQCSPEVTILSTDFSRNEKKRRNLIRKSEKPGHGEKAQPSSESPRCCSKENLCQNFNDRAFFPKIRDQCLYRTHCKSLKESREAEPVPVTCVSSPRFLFSLWFCRRKLRK